MLLVEWHGIKDEKANEGDSAKEQQDEAKNTNRENEATDERSDTQMPIVSRDPSDARNS